MRKIIIAVLVAVMVGGCLVATASPQSDFLDKMGPVAQEIVPQYGLWPSVFLAQAALESGWGTSLLSRQANNYFGRKCLESPCIEIWTPEYRDGVRLMEPHMFQVYPTVRAAIHGYCQQFFRKWKSGAPVYSFDASTQESFVRSIWPTYASDPKYVDKVLNIIEKWGLKSWDKK